METKIKFEDIMENAGSVFHSLKAKTGCPPDDLLLDYVYRELDKADESLMDQHVAQCERCRIETLKMETGRLELDAIVDHAAKSFRTADMSILEKLKDNALHRLGGFVSRIREHLVRYTSPAWTPMYAGAVTTADDIPEQNERFEMDYDEYINLSCYWQGKKKDSGPSLLLSWEANLLTDCNLWVRIFSPVTRETFAELLLGSELEGRTEFYEDDLGFDPSSQKFAITAIIEEKDES